LRKGIPPETTRTGLPQVWASMQENVCLEPLETSVFIIQYSMLFISKLKIGKDWKIGIEYSKGDF
jgi:hypothetical protein